MAILETQGITYAYKTKFQTVYAVKDVSAEFDQGVFYAVSGPSGSGKTTLMSLLAGLDVPSSGEIRFHGESTRELNRDDYRLNHISFIYQNFNLFSHLTVLENAAYPLYMQNRPKNEAEAQAEETLLAVGLKKEQFKRFPNMLSGGEQQRVAIARALCAGSEIILGDEPTGNLDTDNSKNIVEILQRLAHEENRCVIVVTHDPSVAAGADVVFQMRDGQLSEAE